MKIIQSLKIALTSILVAMGSIFGSQKLGDQHVSQTEAAIFQQVQALGFEEVFVRTDKEAVTVRFEIEQLDGSVIDQMIEVAAQATKTKNKADHIVVQSYFLHEPFFGLSVAKAEMQNYLQQQLSAEKLLNHLEFKDLRSINNKLSTDLAVLNFTVDNVGLTQQQAELDLTYQAAAATTDFETVFWNDYLSALTIILKDCPWVDQIVTNISLLANTKRLVISADSKNIISFLDKSISPDQFAELITISEETIIQNNGQANDGGLGGSNAGANSQGKSQDNNTADNYQQLLSSYYQTVMDENYQQTDQYLSSNLQGYWENYGGDAVVTSYDVMTAEEINNQQVIIFVEELLVGYDNSAALNYLNYTLIKEGGVWKIDQIQETDAGVDSGVESQPGAGAGTQVQQGQTGHSQLSADKAISTVGNFLNLIKQNKPQEAKLYVTEQFVNAETPGLFSEYALFNELEVLDTEPSSAGIAVKVRETWESGTEIANYQVIINEAGMARVSSRQLEPR
jgi:hypothetical protein